MDIDLLIHRFTDIYGPDPANPLAVFFAPGRVNLIGEHTDYNGGFVFPTTLNFGTYLVARTTQDGVYRMASSNFTYQAGIPVSNFQKINNEWVNYPLGIIKEFANKGIHFPGLDLYFSGDIPNSAGLSSSASIEMATAVALDDLSGAKTDRVSLVKMCKHAENDFVGVNCGIMDQFVVGAGQLDHALFLDCRSLDYELVPLVLGSRSLLISNTNKKRGLADSKYNERVAECRRAVEYLCKARPIKQLREVSIAEFLEIQELIPEEKVLRRARHVISENDRALKAVKALKANDMEGFGKLMNASHDSLRDDYEVTGFELDTLVEEARKIPGVLGSRMTGAGFGGCTVTLLETGSIEAFKKQVGENYYHRTGLHADFYMAQTGPGACKLI